MISAHALALTGIKVKKEAGGDTGASLAKLEQSRRSGKYDVIYGIDNMVYGKATKNKDLVAYKPFFADRIQPKLVFFAPHDNASWFATPADHGYVGLNVDLNDGGLNGTIESLSRVRLYADRFVTEDPRHSSPGLAFLLTTISAFGENPPYSNALYDWKAFWSDLLRGPDRNLDGHHEGCVLVAPSWKAAYEQHFSAGYGVAAGGLGDRSIVVSYTTSPAYEQANGMKASDVAVPLLANGTTYHQIQTIAIANGTKNLQAAQAWVEFTLTDAFQELTAPSDVMYPVVAGISTSKGFKGNDPPPGSFAAVEFPQSFLATKNEKGVSNLDRWLGAWAELDENPDLNCNLA
ncbi:MAG: thiamine ABC transporter substrate-binding protein [Thermoplasmatota archaeon]